MTHLSLGTAQFGLDYGITNKGGLVDLKNVRSIVREASVSGVKLIDTAHAYGCAQERLGIIGACAKDFKITSKVGAGIDENEMSTKQILELLKKQVEKSLHDLKTNKVDTMLLHTSACLSESHRNGVLDFLSEIKVKGLTNRVGVSVYCQSELDDECISRLDVVQLPISIYNQTMLRDGSLGYLKRMGIKVQGRGVFHQGLLLCGAELWPEWISDSWKQRQRSIESYVKQKGASLVSAALGFIKPISEIDTVVVGVCSPKELMSIVKAWNEPFNLPESLIQISANTDDQFCDPRKWPKEQRG